MENSCSTLQDVITEMNQLQAQHLRNVIALYEQFVPLYDELTAKGDGKATILGRRLEEQAGDIQELEDYFEDRDLLARFKILQARKHEIDLLH